MIANANQHAFEFYRHYGYTYDAGVAPELVNRMKERKPALLPWKTGALFMAVPGLRMARHVVRWFSTRP